MIRNRKIRFLIAALFLAAIEIPAFSQVSCDPSDLFYTFAEGWEMRGIIDHVPSLRPYPLTVIKSILSDVMEKGTDQDKKFAEKYYEEIFGKTWSVAIETTGTGKYSKTDDSLTKQLEVEPMVEGDFSLLNDFISAGYRIGFYNTTSDPYSFLPLYQNFMHDSIQDPADIGPFESYADADTAVAIGTKNFYMQTGVYRVGFGPYLNEGLALNDSAYHSSNISFHLNNEKWAFNQLLSVIGATKNDGSDLSTNKFMSFHSIDFYPIKKLTLTYYETIVYGGRFDPSYFFPAPYMITQGITGCNDNIQMGVQASYKPAPGFAWNSDFFVDDLSVNDLVKLNLDSKNRVAAKTGIIYTPENSLCSRMALDYTAITPFTYSHWAYADDSSTMTADTYNYQNYTNNGICIGSSYPPNSDRIAFTMDLQPVKRLHIQIQSSFLRHANVCESFTDAEATTLLLAAKGVYRTDGSVFTSSMFSGGTHIETAWDYLNFLTQDNKMYVVQVGTTADYSFPKVVGCGVSLKCSYVFEYIKNKGVDSELYVGGNATYNTDGTYTWNGTTYATAAEMVAAAKALWKSAFYDALNNYFSFGVVIKY